MTEVLAALQANALAAQDTIDGLLTAPSEVESTPGLVVLAGCSGCTAVHGAGGQWPGTGTVGPDA